MNNPTEQLQLTTFQWPQGFYSDGIAIGLGATAKKDFGWLVSVVPAAAAGTYTTNKFQAAPTALTKATIDSHHQLQAVVVNSAIANSCTGQQGETDALQEQTWIADKLDIAPHLVGVASTGLIGATLPMTKIQAGVTQLQQTTTMAVTEAVLTTDKKPKTASVQVLVNGQLVTISGFAKGSGMIHPKMATMLGFVTTDAAITGDLLQTTLSQTVDETFNQITVDGDTSTNDMVLAMANGQAGNQPLTQATDTDYATFKAGFSLVLKALAQQIAADGEGATKLVEVNVSGAETTADAQRVAKAVVGSNLTKAALYGEDPNWGRIIAAVGMVDAQMAVDHVGIWINGAQVVAHSEGTAFDPEVVSKAMQGPKVTIQVDLGVGVQTGQAWGCDLTYDYVKINASYHT
ncbi:bifunctional glutamate N-acetyltransferase/amino-acid acetyltransferase ArgJ [Secundilactobacillus kimchicus]|uniref:bifunctional glutamate N-acetyltransferase/amino-acid acetyltransferase ArgJ n=1 Tax=Secundilactobacillus kimchicus TaxID=528209 RepID=UPI001C016261|nr:bifunctional glutamate N-acetyltransferase/amino-acid acetyltransferase ArgJ [Secundilactobacillus kimchicus]MBT9672284.1 bifunctional glutamate N-acetyltransferase/amino-acid acetyltransferase ArgJ [Secundilactobacillus kimchicus]